jgi:CubicO group peptidase (beta-lactamase class C family)
MRLRRAIYQSLPWIQANGNARTSVFFAPPRRYEGSVALGDAAVPIGGFCDPRFERVRDAFRENFETQGELGASVCVVLDRRTVVDLWGGWCDEDGTIAWRGDTLVNAYSVGKALTAMVVLALVERGDLDLDGPVAQWWPEFAAAGKSNVTLRSLMAHRAGLPAVRRTLPEDAMLDWARMTSELAAQAPWWPPGTAHGYHVNTYGFLLGEVVRRVTGREFGHAFAEDLAGPAGAEYHMGLSREHHGRVAPIASASAGAIGDLAKAREVMCAGAKGEREAMIFATYFNPPGLSGFGVANSADWRVAVIPSTNGHATARGVAAIYAAYLDGRAGVGESLRAEAASIHSDGDDVVLGRPSRFGLGLQLSTPERPIGRGRNAYGHYGYGGSLGFADPEAALAFGYLMNRPGDRWKTPRTNALVDAVYSCL